MKQSAICSPTAEELPGVGEVWNLPPITLFAQAFVVATLHVRADEALLG
jgi:hypothetical protein